MADSLFRTASLLTVFLLFTATLFVGCDKPAEYENMSDADLDALAEEIHEEVITVDTHIDIPTTYATDEVDPGVRGDYQVDLPKMEEGKLDVGFFIVYVGQTERTEENYAIAKEMAMTKFNAIHRMTTDMYPEQIGLAHSVDEAIEIHNSGRKVAMIGIENGYVIGKDLSLLEKYYDLGARYITLAHGGHNDISDSSTPRDYLGDGGEEHGGISEFGKEVIKEMNRLGIMVDVSHISKNAMIQAAGLSSAPVVASHSSASAICDHARNMDDEMLIALKENNGVVQTVALGAYVKCVPQEKSDALDSLRQEFGLTSREAFAAMSDDDRMSYDEKRAALDEQWPPATVSDFVDHIDYMVNLIGIDHVGIASDFDGGGGITGWEDASETLNVTRELVARGYSKEDIGKIWGQNLFRVLKANEDVARQMQSDATH
ncbi:MAG: membrane dipeptidase [Rhodothermales bacterium]|nr:membrane dipeptidase [Rhodothermales bacterium]